MKNIVYSVDEIRDIVAPIAKQHKVGKIFLFGSYAKGNANSNSDIDLRLEKGQLKGLLELGALYADLEDHLEKKIDLLTTASLSKDFLKNIANEEILLYSSDYEPQKD